VSWKVAVKRALLSSSSSVTHSAAATVDTVDDDVINLQPPKSDKAKLISRMAKMGQPMLPVMTSPPATAHEAPEVCPLLVSPLPSPCVARLPSG